MIMLTIRTDKPEAELGLFKGHDKLAYSTWPAHRQLSETIHAKIRELLEAHEYTLHDIQGVAVYKGPGSFTGLRIGISVANTLADSLEVPIVGAVGERWTESACTELGQGSDQHIVLPEYGAPARTTKQKK
jgi:tRNA threonylcarbamoyladenosine biosynthesis protein TsaB